MIDKERFLAISGLKLAGKMEKMNDEQLREFDQLLVAFIENFPGDEERIKLCMTDILNNGIDFKGLENSIVAMCKTLGRIHADDLSKKGRAMLDELKNADREKVEASITDFLNSVATLSIDIQMAKYLKTSKKAEEKEGGAAEAADKPTDDQGTGDEKTILAVDDAAISLTILKKNLQDSPYKLVCVNSGDSAMRYLMNNDPDLFLLDIEMPKMNGYELAEKIKESGHEAPIIFLTGNCSREHVMRAIKAGGVDFVVKPINKENLAHKLFKHLYTQNEQ